MDKREILARIENDFQYHAPSENQAGRMSEIRSLCYSLARAILDKTPVSREQSLALTNLEQVSMWANAAIARNEAA